VGGDTAGETDVDPLAPARVLWPGGVGRISTRPSRSRPWAW